MSFSRYTRSSAKQANASAEASWTELGTASLNKVVVGEGDAQATALYAAAFGRDPQFAQFYRSLEAYRASFNSRSDVMVLDPASDFFRAMRSAAPSPPAR